MAALYEDALVYETGSAITSTGALTAYSGAKTGRSPLDKRIVKEEGSEKNVWWGPVNKPMSPQVSKILQSPRKEIRTSVMSKMRLSGLGKPAAVTPQSFSGFPPTAARSTFYLIGSQSRDLNGFSDRLSVSRFGKSTANVLSTT